MPANESCSLCQGSGEYPDRVNGICVNCVESCSICASTTTCETCLDGFFFSSPQQCAPQKLLQADLTNTANPLKLNLVFSYSWLVFFANITNYTAIEITGTSSDNYNYSTSLHESNIIIIITFRFKFEIKNGSLLNLHINYNDSLSDEFILVDKNFSIGLNPYCPPPTTYFISFN